MKSKLNLLRNLFQAYVIGFPTPYGFRLRGKAYMAFKQLSSDLKTLTAKYDAALKVNETTYTRLTDTSTKLKEVHNDAVLLTKVVKELVNHPHVVSPETQSIVDQYRIN